MSSPWTSKRLADVAEIRVSNVDKKTYSSEKPVKLCNYMDIYSNEYVTSRLEFMNGSATRAEIERFGLQYGDVVITKDSETPDDIGISAVIVEQIENLVCGYHLALIRPDTVELDSVYLAKQLSTERVARYFALSASGSTRYGLPISAIESVTVPMPPKDEQAKIAEILSTVDSAIERTEALIAKQERIKTGLMQGLLTRGIDKHGNLRSESTHQFKDSPLGRIPVEWNVCSLEHIGEWSSGGTPSKSNPDYWGNEVPWLCPKDMKIFDIHATIDGLTIAGAKRGSKVMPAQTVFVVVRGMILAHTFPVCISSVPMAFNQDVKAIRTFEHVDSRFFAYWLLSHEHDLLKATTTATHGTKRFEMKDLFDIKMSIPDKNEQTRIINRFDTLQSKVEGCVMLARKLNSLKAALMQDLLTGKKRVAALLQESTTH